MIVTVHAKTKAKTAKIEWIDDTTAKVWVKAIPEKGKANKEIIVVLAQSLDKPLSDITLLRGFTTQIKQFLVAHPARPLKMGGNEKAVHTPKSRP